MKQVYKPWTEWECFKNGLWRKIEREQEPEYIAKAVEFTGDWDLYGAAMQEVIKIWPNTMLHHLTNPSINKRAFLGHCAVQFKIQIPEYITRIAWRELTETQRVNADKVAQETIDKWKRELTIMSKYGRSVATPRGYQMRFPWS